MEKKKGFDNELNIRKEHESFFNKENLNKIVFYGAGFNCDRALEFFIRENLPLPICICDSDPNKWGQTINNIKIISIEEVKEKFDDYYVFITNINYLNEIFEQLKKILPIERIFFDVEILIGFYKNELKKVYSCLQDDYSKEVFIDILKARMTGEFELFSKHCTKPQYFPSDIIKLSEEEIFLDVGAYIGDSIDDIIAITKNKYSKIISCEPNPEHYIHIEKMIKDNDKINLIKKGIGNKSELNYFATDTNNAATAFNENGNIKVQIDTIDNLINEKITFLKMDIEGFELKALEGAINTIKKYKPILAICIYHGFSDFWLIPSFILNLNLGYKIYVRHHSENYDETVLYAIFN